MLEWTDHASGLRYLRSPLLNQCGVVHAFCSRRGGVSPAPFDSLNLAVPAKSCQASKANDPSGGDANTHITANFRKIRAALGVPRLIRIETQQVHGGEVWRPPTKPLPLHQAPRCDGVVTDHPRHLLVCRTADCVPVLMASSDGKHVACAHAGWRGLIAGVLGNTVQSLARQAATTPDRIVAAIGPCIGLAAYEVDDPVANAFADAGLGRCVDRQTWPKPHIDLQACAKKQLTNAGVQQIDGNRCCTHRDAADFFSYRRDGQRTGRMAALIAVKQPCGKNP